MSESARSPDRPDTGGPGPLLALAAGGLGLIIYICSFFQGLPVLSTTAIMPLLLGGGLLAAATALPKAGRLLVPAAVAVMVGVLALIQVVFAGDSRVSVMAIVVVVLAVLQAAAVVAAVLFDNGMLASPDPAVRLARQQARQARRPQGPAPGYPPPGGGYPGGPPQGGQGGYGYAQQPPPATPSYGTPAPGYGYGQQPNYPGQPGGGYPGYPPPGQPSGPGQPPQPRPGPGPQDSSPDTPPDAGRGWGQPGPGGAPGSADRLDDDEPSPSSTTRIISPPDGPGDAPAERTSDGEGRPNGGPDRT